MMMMTSDRMIQKSGSGVKTPLSPSPADDDVIQKKKNIDAKKENWNDETE